MAKWDVFPAFPSSRSDVTTFRRPDLNLDEVCVEDQEGFDRVTNAMRVAAGQVRTETFRPMRIAVGPIEVS